MFSHCQLELWEKREHTKKSCSHVAEMKFMISQIESDNFSISLSQKFSFSYFLFTFRFSPGMDAVLARCCFCNGALFAFVMAGVLTSIVLRLKIFGDLLRVNFSLASNRLCDENNDQFS